MATYTGIISFPAVFTPKLAKGATEPKYSASLLFHPQDPELARAYADFEAARIASYPSGLPRGADACLMLYDDKYQGKDYYDPRFAGWWVLSCSAKADDRPHVVDANRQPIIDPSEVASGMICSIAMGMSGYTKGTGGVGGWLNGVLCTGQLGPMGRLDNKQSVEQMFGAPTPGSVPPVPPVPTAPLPPAVPVAPVRVMLPAAQGATYEALIGAGWTDALLIQHQMMAPPNGVVPSFT